MTQIARGGELMFFASLWRKAYENRYVIYPLFQMNDDSKWECLNTVELVYSGHAI